MANITAPRPLTEAEELRMSLWDHLNELRSRVMWAGASILIGTIIGIFFAGDVLNILRAPYCAIVETAAQCELKILDPTGNVTEYFRVALLVGAILSVPIVTYQIMLFVLPALTRKEKSYLLLSIPFITLLFLTGTIFTWNILLPPALSFLEGFGNNIFQPEWTADAYIGFVTSLIFWMSCAFESPLVFFVLGMFGVVTPRQMIKNWRFAVVGSAIAAALITPTIDPVNMALVIIPLLGLYILSIILVWVAGRIITPAPYVPGAQ